MIEDRQQSHPNMLDNKAYLFVQIKLVKNSHFIDQPIGLWDFCQLHEEASIVKNHEDLADF
ncbi:hypothetical protein A6769_30215 [Nostoc punctiforme NIES-2108]|uniref:Uncharacterized protein n=1 Tax=Nostoc punctiforme NIES-2108 TaxID=1356359 RepID=A0A367R7M1_NOSPU|nr:hypothetical protein A6769_30215 [Nostoc punctiforme NIES-2108]